MIDGNLSEFKGKPVEDWTGEENDFANVVYRLRVEYDDEQSLVDKLSSLLDLEGSDQIESLVIGAWQGDDSQTDSSDVVEALVGARGRLPNLRHLFFGDITSEENEMSWIVLSDMSPLLAAYPNLLHLTVRGCEGLTFGQLAHTKLQELIVQSGGLAPDVVREISAAALPELRTLEIWLGDPGYGGDATVDDLAPLLAAGRFPKLRTLEFNNTPLADEIAGVIVLAPVLDQLETLGLALGTLSDIGAKRLLDSPRVRKLRKLNLRHHYISPPMQEAMKTIGIEVDISDPMEPHEPGTEEDRYISVAE